MTNLSEMMISVYDGIENIVEKGETLREKEKMLVTSIFSFFNNIFKKASSIS